MSRPDLSIFHYNVLIWKTNFSTFLIWPSKNISLSNNDYSSIIKNNWKMLNYGGEQLLEKQETALVW